MHALARPASAALTALALSSTWMTAVAAAGRDLPVPADAGPLSPQAALAAAHPYGGTPIDVLTFHDDNLRTGWNRQETDLTVASVGSSKFGKLQTLTVDGDVLAQPLLVSNFTMADKSTRDVLLVVTESNSVYAFDFKTYEKLWSVNLGTPQNANDVGCSFVHPTYGISATPVIVRERADRATVYLVSATEPTHGDFHTKLYAIDLADGSNTVPAVEIEATVKLEDGSKLSYSPRDQWFRAGLAYNDGGIYISASSHCDNNASSIAGWVMRYDRQPKKDLLKQTRAFSTIRTKAGYQLAAIWAAGFAPAIDTDGSVFAVTGNGNYAKGGRDWGETVMRLTPDLGRVDDFFTPASYASLNARDLDFGSGGVLLIPQRDGQKAPPLAVAMGKDDVLYLLDRTKLGHQHANDSGALQWQRLGSSGNGVWGGPCYWYGPSGGLVYYQTSEDALRAYAVDTGASPSLTEVAHGSSNSGFGGSMPVGSSMGSQAGTGVVWVVNRNSGALEAFDAEHLGTPLFTAAIPPWTAGSPFLTPMQANGRVVVGSSKAVAIYGLSN
jgi:hypothetical protein